MLNIRLIITNIQPLYCPTWLQAWLTEINWFSKVSYFLLQWWIFLHETMVPFAYRVFHVHVFCLFFFFFFCVWTVTSHGFTIHALFITVHALKNIKNGSHDTIYTFKNYFTTVFSVFSFQFSVFSNNKLNPNGPVMDVVGLVYDVNPVLRAVMTLRHHSMMLSSQLFQEV